MRRVHRTVLAWRVGAPLLRPSNLGVWARHVLLIYVSCGSNINSQSLRTFPTDPAIAAFRGTPKNAFGFRPKNKGITPGIRYTGTIENY